jgi:hypothetical protein
MEGFPVDTDTDENSPPTAAIVSHNDGEEVVTAEEVLLTGAVADPDDVFSDLEVTWRIGTEVACPSAPPQSDGTTSCSTSFEEGEVAVYLLVVDPGGARHETSITLNARAANTPPTAPTVEIRPETPKEGIDDLVCSVTSPSTDLQEDTITYQFDWTVDSESYVGLTSDTSLAGDTIPRSNTREDETWSCRATPHDGTETGEPSGESTVVIGCNPSAPPGTISGSGREADGLGVAAWNTNAGAPEPAKTGHDLGAVSSLFTGNYAYYYLASREVVDGGTGAAMTANALFDLPLTSDALAVHSFTPEDLRVRFNTASLGGDIQGVDWGVTGALEWRNYSGATFTFLVQGESLLEVSGDIKLSIDYGDFATFGDEVMTASLGPELPVDVSGSSSSDVQAVATALLADLGAGPISVFVGQLIQPAIEKDFDVGGRWGAYFDILNVSVTGTKLCE